MREIKQAIELLNKAKQQYKRDAANKGYNAQFRDAAQAEAGYLRDMISGLTENYKLRLCPCGKCYDRRQPSLDGSSDFCLECLDRQDSLKVA